MPLRATTLHLLPETHDAATARTRVPVSRRRYGCVPLNRLRALLLAALPHHALSRLTFWLTRRQTRLIKPVMAWFIRSYGVDMSEAADPDPGAYPTFNAFFTRPLKPGARPLAGAAHTLVSPVDGRVSQAGAIDDGTLIQAKDHTYSAASLLGSAAAAEPFCAGSFATLYLAPGDYHRIHMPLGGQLRHMTHVPGRLFSVAPWTTTSVPGLFARNERVCAHFDTDRGPLALVLVGAINVAAIETVWAGLVTPPSGRGIRETPYPPATAPRLERGAEMGRFNMGSTVIVLSAWRVDWAAHIAPGERVRMGEAMVAPAQRQA